MSRLKPAGFAILFVSLAGVLCAQGWRGTGRVTGKVTDENSKPLEGVTVRLVLPQGGSGPGTKTNGKGEWLVAGLAAGQWQIEFARS